MSPGCLLAAPARRRTPVPQRPALGFTLMEVMIALALLAILAAIAYPTYQSQMRKVRRSDGIATITRVQQAAERWRSNNATYTGTLGAGGLNQTDHSAEGHYGISIAPSASGAATGYSITASAVGLQTGDTACAVLRLEVEGANMITRSGEDDSVANDAAANRKCWNQ
jgi:type IV pilus assembly protein PilE